MKKLFVVFAAMVLMVITCCTSSELGSSTEVPNQSATASVALNSDTEIKVTDTKNPIFGTRIVIPKDAAIDPINVVIGYEDNLPSDLNANALSMGAVQVSKVIIPHVTGGGPSTFKHLVRITIPYDKTKANGLPPAVVYWDEEHKIYRPVTVVEIDKEKGLVTFVTSHFSKFTAIIISSLVDLLVDPLGVSFPDVDSGFRMGVDSILQKNFSSYNYKGGICAAFASMSTYYFSLKKSTKLYEFAQDGIKEHTLDDTLVRSALSYTYGVYLQKRADDLWNNLRQTIRLDGIDVGIEIIENMILTEQPVVLTLAGAGVFSDFAHAVVVYRYDSANKRFLIYDNNFPKDEVTFEWNAITGFGSYSRASAYSGFSTFWIGYASDATFGAPSEFDKIISEWESGVLKDYYSYLSVNDFQSTAHNLRLGSDVTIVIPSSTSTVTLSGHFNSPAGNKNIKNYLWVIQDIGDHCTESVSEIPASGNFSFSVDGTLNSSITLIVSGHNRSPFSGLAAYGEFSLTLPGTNNFFNNLGFETGDFINWDSYTYLLYDGSIYTPTKKYIVSPGFDPIATDIPTVIAGKYAAQVNDYDNNYHATKVSQKATVPSIGSPEIKFYWAAILEDPQHLSADQPYVDVLVRNNTKSIELYHQHFYTADPLYPGWKSYVYNGSNWKAIAWQTIIVPLSSTYGGDEVELIVEGADCNLGGHGGYVYLDGEE